LSRVLPLHVFLFKSVSPQRLLRGQDPDPALFVKAPPRVLAVPFFDDLGRVSFCLLERFLSCASEVLRLIHYVLRIFLPFFPSPRRVLFPPTFCPQFAGRALQARLNLVICSPFFSCRLLIQASGVSLQKDCAHFPGWTCVSMGYPLSFLTPSILVTP